MAAIKIKTKSFISPNISMLAVPILYLIILIVVSVFSIKTGYGQIIKQRADISNAKKIESVLNEKLITLQDAQGFIAKYVDPVSFAMPDKNPSLLILSQMKQIIQQRPISLTDLNLSKGSGTASTNTIALSFNVVGSVNDVLSLYQDMTKLAPLMVFDNFDISHDAESIAIETRASSFFSEYPEKLPSITQPISKITTNEISILDEITLLTAPTFSKLNPNGPFTRDNPFAI
jgi:hypothetical protein